MRTMASSLIGLTMIALVFAGCMGDNEVPGATDSPADPLPSALPALETVGEDAAGDAYEQSTHEALGQASTGCFAAFAARSACLSALREAGAAVDPVGATPAAPSLDLLSLRIGDSATSFVVELQVAGIHDGFLDAVPEDGDSVQYLVCWAGTGVNCVTFVVRHDGDAITKTAYYDVVDQACNDWSWCVWATDFEVIEGTDGIIRWTVPRDLFAERNADAVLNEFYVIAARAENDLNGYHYNVHTGIQDGSGAGAIRDVYRFPVDYLAAIDYHVRSDAPVVNPDVATNTEWTVPPLGSATSDFDMLRMLMVETPTHLKIAHKMAKLEPVLPDHSVDMYVAGPDGPVRYVYVRYADGEPRVDAFHCLGDCQRIHAFDVEVDYVAGTPGWLNVTFDRRDLGAPHRGALVTLAYTDLYYAVPSVSESAGPLGAHVHENVPMYDWTDYPAPFWFTHDTYLPEAAVQPFSAEDAVGDVPAQPPLVDEGTAMRYDITLLESHPKDADLTEVRLGLADLSKLTVPSGYQGALYATGVQTQSGDFMFGLYRGADDRQEFFCAPDTAVFADTPSDPMDVGRTEIEGGVLSTGSGEHGAAAGVLRFMVPNDCLGAEAGATPAPAFRAGTFLIRDLGTGAAQVERMDDTESFGPVTFGGLQTATAGGAASGSSAFAEPFGVQNFWDMLGIALALVLAGGGAFLVARRRHRLRRYLAEIERASAIQNARARETVYGEVRMRARTDLTKGRLTEPHYVIIERRIEGSLSQARIEAFTDTFGELPHRLVRKLEAVLSDGVITKDELELVSDMVSAAHIPAADKERVITRLQKWDLEDSIVRA